MSNKVTIELELSEEFLSDILTIAFDGDYGGCWYWARPCELRENKDGEVLSAWEIDPPSKGVKAGVNNLMWRSVSIKDRETDNVFVVTHSALTRGIQELFKPGVLPKRGDIRDAILKQDSGQIDVEGADVIVQLGVMGAVIYG